MSDLQLTFNSDSIDLNLKNGNLTLDNSLTTTVLITLFTDLVEYQMPEGIVNNWWGNHITQPPHPLGSNLWQLQRTTCSEQTTQQARLYALDALQWLVEEGLVNTLDVTVTALSKQGLLLKVIIDETQAISIQWQVAQGHMTVLNSLS